MKYRLRRTRETINSFCAYRSRNGEVRLDASWPNRDELILPERLDGKPVTAIGQYVFNDTRVKRLVLPGTLRSIGYRAFSEQKELRSLVIPPSVTAIDETAFDGAQDVCLCVTEGSYAHRFAEHMGLRFAFTEPEVEIRPEDNLVIGDFLCRLEEDGTLTIREYNGTAERLVVPAEMDGRRVRRIDRGAFYCRIHLREVDVEEGVEELGVAAFKRCRNLRRISLPAGMRVLGAMAFQFDTRLEEVSLPWEISEIPFAAFELCTRLKEIVLPAQVRQIGRFAFNGCMQLERIHLPEGLEQLDMFALGRCCRLTHITLPQSLRWASSSAFHGCLSLRRPDVPAGAKIDESAFKHCLPAEDDWYDENE